MAEKEPDTGPSLELPSLFGGRKRRAAAPEAEQRDEAAAAPRTEAPVETPAARSETAQEADADTRTIDRVDDPHGPGPDDSTAVIEPVAPTAHTPAMTPTAVPSPPPAEPEEPRAAEPSPPAGGRRRRAGSQRSLPDVSVSAAAFLTGAAVGLIGCGLTYLGLQGCELVTGTDSCGGPGLLVLAVILVAMVLIGAAILRALRVPEPANVSFLGVGVLTVVVLLFLISYLYDPWMFVVIPAVTAVSFSLARWVSTLYAEDVLDEDEGMPRHDIR